MKQTLLIMLALVITCVQITSFKSYAVSTFTNTVHSHKSSQSASHSNKPCHPEKDIGQKNDQNDCCSYMDIQSNRCQHSTQCDLNCNHCLSISFVATTLKQDYWQVESLSSQKVISPIPHFYSIHLQQVFRPPIS